LNLHFVISYVYYGMTLMYYFDCEHKERPHIHAAYPISCPLGSIVFAGTIWKSRATYGHAPPPTYMRRTPHHLLVYTLQGCADYSDSTGVKATLTEGSLVWSAAGINQSYGPRKGSTWSEFYIWFEGPLFDTWQEQGYPGSKTRIIKLTPLAYWFERFTSIISSTKTISLNENIAKLCEYQQLLADILQVKTPDHDQNREWLNKACSLLLEKKQVHTSLKKVAESMHISYSLFRKKFLRLSGKTPGNFKMSKIIKETYLQLVNTDDSIATIASTYGFHDQFHFSKRFKQFCGISPTEFRKQNTT